MDLDKLEKALQKSWSKETSYCPNEWNGSNPSLGQCAITALIVNDYLGGEIVWSEAILLDGQKISHYFNLIDGKEVDLTRAQFLKDTIVPKGVEKKRDFASTREYMMSYESTVSRYKVLKNKVAEYFSNN